MVAIYLILLVGLWHGLPGRMESTTLQPGVEGVVFAAEERFMIALRIYHDDQNQKNSLRSIIGYVLDREQLIRRQLSSSTLTDYETLANHWERLMGLPVEEINQAAVVKFREGLIAESNLRKRRSISTANKMLRYLKRVVSRCFPADSHNPDGLGLINYFAWPAALPVVDRMPRTFSQKSISALYHAAGMTHWPRSSVAPANVWQVLIVLGYNLGARTYDLVNLQWSGEDGIGVSWEDFGGMGSITYRAKKTAKLQRIPMHPVVRHHLQAMPQQFGNRIFPESMSRSNKNVMGNHWKKLLEAAELPQEHRIEDFRKTCNTAYEERFPGVGQYILGHSKSGVNAKHYFNPTKAVIRAVRRLPQPEAFLQHGGSYVSSDTKTGPANQDVN